MALYKDLDSKGEYDQIYQQSLADNSLEGIYWRVTAAWRLGQLEEAMKVSQAHEHLFHTHSTEEKRLYGLFLLRVGTLHGEQGDIKLELEYSQHALKIMKELGNANDEAGVLNNLGLLHYYRGEYQKATEHLRMCFEIYRQEGTTSELSMVLNNLGLVLFVQGKYEEAIHFIERGYDYATDSSNVLDIVHSLYNFISCLVSIGAIDKAKTLLAKIEKIAEHNLSDLVNLYLIYSKALITKQSNRARDKIRAYDLFAKIINEFDINIEITLLAMKHYIDLLLLELQTFNQSEILSEITQLIDKLNSISLKNNLFPSFVDSLILQSKLASITGDFDKASKILETGKQVASDKELVQLEKLIAKEQSQLVNVFSKYQEILQSNDTFAKKMKTVDIQDYMEEILHIFKVDYD